MIFFLPLEGSILQTFDFISWCLWKNIYLFIFHHTQLLLSLRQHFMTVLCNTGWRIFFFLPLKTYWRKNVGCEDIHEQTVPCLYTVGASNRNWILYMHTIFPIKADSEGHSDILGRRSCPRNSWAGSQLTEWERIECGVLGQGSWAEQWLTWHGLEVRSRWMKSSIAAFFPLNVCPLDNRIGFSWQQPLNVSRKVWDTDPSILCNKSGNEFLLRDCCFWFD